MFYRYLVFHIHDIELCCQCIHIDQPKYKVPFQWKCFLYNHVSVIHQALSHSEIAILKPNCRIIHILTFILQFIELVA